MKRILKKSVLAAALTLAATGSAIAGDVRVTYPFYSSYTGEFFKQSADEFMKKNPDINIVLEEVNWDSLQQKLTTDISADQNADIAISATIWLPDFVEAEVVEPLDSYMDSEFKNRFIPAFLEPANIDGKYYGLPIAASARALYYNKSLFDQAGLSDAPKTWGELKEYSEKISKIKDHYGFGLQGVEIDTDTYWYYALWSFGGDLLTPEGASGVGSDAAIKAANFYKSMIDEGLTQPGVTSYTRENVQDLFKQGRVGMMITGPWLNGQIEKEAPDLNYGVAVVPTEVTTGTAGVTDSIVMFSNSKNKKEAWKFLSFLFEKKQRENFSINEGMLPVNKEVAQNPHYTENPKMKAFAEVLPSAKFVPLTSAWGEVSEATINALQSIYLGEKTPEDALKEAEKKANSALGF
ncbi:ABC transporter substrate-binding protein [Parasalinivibrio latis]|uniref:ABC transporter substrate-binding protein n=1 Tax=Parasalinivibrio latis TaxID=2952610 RepID=UPI0030E5B03B